MSSELTALNEWMREPDFAENFSLADITDWINRRPIATVARLASQEKQEPVAWRFRYGDWDADKWSFAIYHPSNLPCQDNLFFEPLFIAPQNPQPAPGWDITDDMVEDACKAYADATNYYIPFHRGLSSVSSDEMRKGMRAALKALRTPPTDTVATVNPITADTPYPSTKAMKAAVELEIHRALGSVQTVVIGQLIQQAIDAALSHETAPVESFQSRVQPWMMACFGPEISADRIERNHRFLEEALELVQSTGCTQSEAHQLVDYVYGRPTGETYQEIGGVMVTLAALCLALGEDMHKAGETELARVWTKVEKIRAKQAAKPKHSPLPGPSTPAPVAANASAEARLREVTTGQLFNTLLSRINFDGMDPRSFSLAELHGAIEGAEWPRSLTNDLLSVVSALDRATGDTDAPYVETDEDYRDQYPVPWAMQKLNAMLQTLSTHPHASETKDVDWDDVRGMAPNATGDLSSEEFIRQQRDEWPDPHASDCEKQGETTKIKVPLPDWLGPDTPENRARLQAFVEGRPSDRPADVTKLLEFVVRADSDSTWSSNRRAIVGDARALLHAFTVGRR